MMDDITIEGVRVIAEVFHSTGSVQIRVTEAGELFMVYIMEGMVVCRVKLFM